MRCQQTIIAPFISRSHQPKPKAAVKKHNLVPLTRPNRAKLSQPRRKLPKATQLNWASTIRSQGCSTKCVNKPGPPIQRSQLMDTPSMSSPTSPAVPPKITDHSNYCAICTPHGKICQKSLQSHWDEDEEDQAKDKDNDNDQKQSQTNPSFSTAMTRTLKTPKPCITKYSNSMSSETPKMYTPKEKCRHNTIVPPQELNTTEC